MDIKINKLDGPSRICEITEKKNIIQTPNIFFLTSPRFHKPISADFLLNEKLKKNESLEIKNNIQNYNIIIDTPKFNYFDYKYKIIYSKDDIQKININKK